MVLQVVEYQLRDHVLGGHLCAQHGPVQIRHDAIQYRTIIPLERSPVQIVPEVDDYLLIRRPEPNRGIVRVGIRDVLERRAELEPLFRKCNCPLETVVNHPHPISRRVHGPVRTARPPTVEHMPIVTVIPVAVRLPTWQPIQLDILHREANANVPVATLVDDIHLEIEHRTTLRNWLVGSDARRVTIVASWALIFDPQSSHLEVSERGVLGRCAVPGGGSPLAPHLHRSIR
mmetsp:Transcript_5847/g.16373  ORF Transcript_5847/g.16373 Transcript_5847/m.16373 type:complete len:231 (+) Transcript_5847:411-1103(+)